MELAQQIVRNQRMNPPWEAMIRATGSMLVFCSDTCLESYIDSTTNIDEHVATIERASQLSCMHCGWCGDVLWAPELCVSHEDGCPGWRWDMTFQASECVLELVELFGLPLAEDIVDEARELGSAFGPHGNGPMLARSVWAARKAME